MTSTGSGSPCLGRCYDRTLTPWAEAIAIRTPPGREIFCSCDYRLRRRPEKYPWAGDSLVKIFLSLPPTTDFHKMLSPSGFKPGEKGSQSHCRL